MNKIFKGILVLALLLVSTNIVSAASFDIDKVEVDGTVMTAGKTVFTERGEDLTVSVWLTGTAHSNDVRVKAYIGGYEYDDVRDVSEIFEVEENVSYRKTLHLEIPEDIEVEEDGYTLHVKVYDDDDEIDEEYRLRVREKRHYLSIMDVIVRPSDVEAGRVLFTTVRVENLGDKKEEDIKVTVSIPDLGISARDYIDELTADEDPDDDEEDSASSNEIFFRIPENTKSGEYTLKVEVEYNRGHDTITATEKVYVKGTTAVADVSTINLDASAKTAKAGEEVAFKVMIANLGEEAKIYTAEVAGERLFASSRVEPNMITIQPGTTGELYVFLTTKEDAEGSNAFTIKVKAANQIVKEFNSKVDFESKTEQLKNALIIGFGVLVILLIVLGLIIAFQRMRGSEEEPGEEGQSYY